MNELWIQIVLAIVALVLTGISYYFHVKDRVSKAISGAINDSEVDGIVGKEKFNNAVDQVMLIIPAVMKPFITRSYVENLVQIAFDNIEAYAKKQVLKENENKLNKESDNNESDN